MTRRHGPTPCVGFVGPSGVGKTSLVERLLSELGERGLRVGAVKHASHGFLADRPGKDSYRLYESGAAAVALVSREQLATFTRLTTPESDEVSLERALSSLPPDLDLVLVEGFSWEPIPRIVLTAGASPPPPEHGAAGRVLRTVAVPPSAGRQPYFSSELVGSLVSDLEAFARRPVDSPQRGELET